jgi:hypothetical protein
VYDLLAWLQASRLGHFMRDSGPWTYALVNLTHILGVATLFGSILVLDLRLLGAWRRLPLAALSAATAPVGAVGFVVAVTSGIGLLATNATEYAGNPFLLVKFPAIALGVVNVLLLGRSRAWRAHRVRALTASEERQLAAMGAVSLASWFTAVAAGRLIGYW